MDENKKLVEALEESLETIKKLIKELHVEHFGGSRLDAEEKEFQKSCKKQIELLKEFYVDFK